MNQKRNQLLLWVVLITLSRASDLYVTYRIDPYLLYETNPMVRTFGFGWAALITFQSFAVAVMICLRALDLFMAGRWKPEQTDMSFSDYVAWWYMERPWPMWKCLCWSFPRTLRASIRLAGYVGVATLVIVGFWISSFMLAAQLWPPVMKLYGVHVAGRDLGVLSPLIVATLCLPFFHYRSLRQEYALYQREVATGCLR